MDSRPQGIHVVEAGAADVDAIGTLFWRMWDEAGPDAPGFAGATEEVIAEIAQPDAIRARIGGPERHMFVAYIEDSAVGFAATRTIDTEQVELAGIVVLQSMLGHGIGTPLVAAAVAAARERGFERMSVSTEVDNQRAIGFYEARGFEIVGESTADVDGVAVAVSNLERRL
jgi:ribosomal protein S18 acetylase RimI-like enzyme